MRIRKNIGTQIYPNIFLFFSHQIEFCQTLFSLSLLEKKVFAFETRKEKTPYRETLFKNYFS
jgi:hypothetical protein